LGFEVKYLGFRVEGLGLRVKGLGPSRALGTLGLRVQDFRRRAEGIWLWNKG
jgi:hypothetical protein